MTEVNRLLEAELGDIVRIKDPRHGPEPLLADQELYVTFRYWEGAVSVRGTDASGTIGGRGYVELVGYKERQRVY